MKKRRWYAITCETQKDPEEIVGFSRAMMFDRRVDAVKEFKENGYTKKRDKRGYRYFIRRIFV